MNPALGTSHPAEHVDGVHRCAHTSRVSTEDQKRRIEELRASLAHGEKEREESEAFYLRAREGFVRCSAELFDSLESLAREVGLVTERSSAVQITDKQTQGKFEIVGHLRIGPRSGKHIAVKTDSSFQMLLSPRGFSGLKVSLFGSRTNASMDIVYNDKADKLVIAERGKVRDVDPLEILELLKK